jgi:hypothetical protein
MSLELANATQQTPIVFTEEQISWMRKNVLSPLCLLSQCGNPAKIPLLKSCLARVPIAKGVKYLDLMMQSVCRDEGSDLMGEEPLIFYSVFKA